MNEATESRHANGRRLRPPNMATQNSTRGRRNTRKPGKREKFSSETRNRGWRSKYIIIIVIIIIITTTMILPKSILFVLALGTIYQPLNAVGYVFISNLLPLFFISLLSALVVHADSLKIFSNRIKCFICHKLRGLSPRANYRFHLPYKLKPL